MQSVNILEVESLSVRFGESSAKAVEEISFGLAKGETLGIAGESGSGKTASILSILGLLQRATVEGSAKFEGQELIGASNKLLNGIRGKRIGLVLQDPLQLSIRYKRWAIRFLKGCAPMAGQKNGQWGIPFNS